MIEIGLGGILGDLIPVLVGASTQCLETTGIEIKENWRRMVRG